MIGQRPARGTAPAAAAERRGRDGDSDPLAEAWIAYVFGAAIVAITITLVAGFTK